MIRHLTKNFIEANVDRSINGLPINMAAVVEEELHVANMQEYVDNVVMQMEHDAQGFLLNMVPIALRINVYIVNIDTSAKVRVKMS